MNESNTSAPVTHIAQGTRIKADIETDSIIQVSGRVEGDIRTESHLVLEKSGHVTGTVICNKATISGKLTGELRVSTKLEVYSTANIDGFVFAKRIQVEEGALLIGIVKAGPKIDVLNAKISGQKSPIDNNKATNSTEKSTEKSENQSGEDSTKTVDIPEKKPLNRFLKKLLIGIPFADKYTDQTNAVYKSSEKFLQALDFSLEIYDEPDFSPYFHNLTYVRKCEEVQSDISEDFNKGKALIETAFLKKESEEDATKLQRSAVTLTNLIENFEQLALLIGEILIIKFQQNDVQTIAVEIVSETVLQELQKDPKLITDPVKLYSML